MWRRRRNTSVDVNQSSGMVPASTEGWTKDSMAALISAGESTLERSLLNELLPVARNAAAIRKALNQVVVGQDGAKNAIGVLLSAHLNKNRYSNRSGSPNALLIGPTGVGKTHTVQTAAAYLGLPYVNIDCASLVPSNEHEGMTIEDVLIDLLISAETILAERNMFAEVSAPQLASRGLIFLDEFDKLRAREGNDWTMRVQRRLLRLVEGSFQSIRESRGEVLDTSRMIFFASGTFDGVRDPGITSRRPAQVTSTLREPDSVISADLVTFGFVPELIARLPVLVAFTPLSTDELVEVLANDAVSPMKIWEEYFHSMSKELAIDDDAKVLVAAQAASLNMGARGLQQVLFPVLARLSMEYEGTAVKHVRITREICERQLRMGW